MNIGFIAKLALYYFGAQAVAKALTGASSASPSPAEAPEELMTPTQLEAFRKAEETYRQAGSAAGEALVQAQSYQQALASQETAKRLAELQKIAAERARAMASIQPIQAGRIPKPPTRGSCPQGMARGAAGCYYPVQPGSGVRSAV